MFKTQVKPRAAGEWFHCKVKIVKLFTLFQDPRPRKPYPVQRHIPVNAKGSPPVLYPIADAQRWSVKRMSIIFISFLFIPADATTHRYYDDNKRKLKTKGTDMDNVCCVRDGKL